MSNLFLSADQVNEPDYHAITVETTSARQEQRRQIAGNMRQYNLIALLDCFSEYRFLVFNPPRQYTNWKSHPSRGTAYGVGHLDMFKYELYG